MDLQQAQNCNLLIYNTSSLTIWKFSLPAFSNCHNQYPLKSFLNPVDKDMEQDVGSYFYNMVTFGQNKVTD